jgi:hypothetical protein
MIDEGWLPIKGDKYEVHDRTLRVRLKNLGNPLLSSRVPTPQAIALLGSKPFALTEARKDAIKADILAGGLYSEIRKTHKIGYDTFRSCKTELVQAGLLKVPEAPASIYRTQTSNA